MRLIPILLAACLLSACQSATSSTAPTPPPVVSTTPASIRLTAGSRPDQQLDVTATVLTSDGHFVPSVPVTFSVAAGSIAPVVVTTDATGIAKTIASTPSLTTVSASAAGLTVQITVAASAPPPPASNPPIPPPPLPTPPPPAPTPTPAPALRLTLGCSQALTTACNVSAVDENGVVVTSQLGGAVTWDFGDGSPTAPGGALNTHPYPQSGTYMVFVSATIVTGGITRSGSAQATVKTP